MSRSNNATVRYRTGTVLILNNTVRYDTVQYGTVPYGTVPYGTVPYDTVQYMIIEISCSFLGAGLSPREVRTGYEGTQQENCGFLC